MAGGYIRSKIRATEIAPITQTGTQDYDVWVRYQGVGQPNHWVLAIRQDTGICYWRLLTDEDGYVQFRGLSSSYNWVFVEIDPTGYYNARVFSHVRLP
jgi:hypothetical protein